MPSTTLNDKLAASVAAALLGACGGSGDDPGTSAMGPEATAASQPSVRTASVPAEPCAWIPVGEVEAVVGKLAGPPENRDGCRYTLVIPPEVSARRQEYLDRMQQLRDTFKGESFGDYKGPMANYHSDPSSYAITLVVDVSGDVAGELGAAGAMRMLQAELRQDGSAEITVAPRMPEGWDAVVPVPYGISGRLGHLRVNVSGEAPDVPRPVAEALAARVRDRIPDLPFPADNPYQVPVIGKKDDPCSLLTAAEAEAVLGPLVVDPFPASSYTPSLALADGNGCAYYTAGHHVFSLVPVWSGGQQDFKLNKSMSGLVSTALPQELTVVKGPWDDSHVAATGSLLFLKEDQLLEVHYMTSSTDMRGAIKLAALAVPRMVSR